ncbi:DoxX family membrane protein [Naumannella sp. ID2617S]|nr:DoxX family membrane protein [Naumannella sp. ID2617S]
MSIAQIPARLAAGAFVLNAGLGKLDLPEEGAQQLQSMGSAGVPQLQQLSPQQFKTFISATEIGVGALLLAPFVPGWLAGAALAAFSGGLLNMYRNTPGMTVDGIRPTQEGTAVAKDVFMLGIAGSLIADSVISKGRKKVRKAFKS